MSRQILVDNAYESWSQAIKFCRKIEDGICTLGCKKFFVSSLHNAVELFLKQIMLDNCDYRVVTMKKGCSKDGNLMREYLQASDLNEFFCDLEEEERKEFYSIEFNKIIDICKKDIMPEFNFTEELKKLQKLRNDETHFYIENNDYLDESDFKQLYNFMVDFYLALIQHKLLPWKFGEPFGEYEKLSFSKDKLKNFTYKKALKKSENVKYIFDKLNGELVGKDFTNGVYSFVQGILNLYKIEKLSFEECIEYFESMYNCGLITFTPELDVVPEDICKERLTVCGYIIKIEIN